MHSKNLPGKHHKSHEFSETDELLQVCGFIELNYPNLKYFCDGAGLDLHKNQAIKFYRMRSDRGVNDLFILKPVKPYYGLLIEFKKTGEAILNADGKLKKNKHLEEQSAWLEYHENEGYYTCFSIGYEETCKLIKQYLEGKL